MNSFPLFTQHDIDDLKEALKCWHKVSMAYEGDDASVLDCGSDHKHMVFDGVDSLVARMEWVIANAVIPQTPEGA